MNIQYSRNGDNAGTVEARIGMVINVDAEKGQNEELADFMDEFNNYGADQTISDIDEEEKLIWVEDCPYAIDAHIVWKDI